MRPRQAALALNRVAVTPQRRYRHGNVGMQAMFHDRSVSRSQSFTIASDGVAIRCRADDRCIAVRADAARVALLLALRQRRKTKCSAVLKRSKRHLINRAMACCSVAAKGSTRLFAGFDKREISKTCINDFDTAPCASLLC